MWSWRSRQGRSGQVLVIVLLGIVLLAGLIFYVVNVGTQVNNRLGMQNAADSAAISGATWMARSMNLIAMNNVAQTRMLALVPILDAFPMATAMALDDAVPWYQALDAQLNKKGVQSPYPLEQQFVTNSLKGLGTNLATQSQILQGMNTFFNDAANGYDVSQLTFWSIDGRAGPPPHGQLWQAAKALADMSAAVNDTSGVLGQSDAVRYGRDNGAQTSFIVPILPEKPGRQGAYSDFWLPIRGKAAAGYPPYPRVPPLTTIPDGTIPDRYPPYTPLEFSHPPLGERYRLGPFDRLFGWRNYQYTYKPSLAGGAGAVAPPQPSNGSDDLGGGTVMGGPTPPGPPSGSVPDQVIGYATYGPYTWMMWRIAEYTNPGNVAALQSTGGLWATQFYRYLRAIADYKLGYMCPWQLSDRDPKSIHYPQWVTDYSNAIALAATQSQTINRTAFYALSISSRFTRGEALYLSPGSFVTNYIRGRKSPVVYLQNGWFDPNAQNGWQRLCDFIWHDETTKMMTTPWDAIGLTIPVDAQGNPVPQPVYVIRFFVFVGIDVGQNMEVRNPANWTSPDEPPGPTLIDLSHGDYVMSDTHDQGVRRDVFTYLGVCQVDNSAAVWSQKFGRPSPYDAVVGFSQAEIFNTTSWDLWTQDWKVKLVPVSNLAPVSNTASWVSKMASTAQQAGDTQGQVRSEDVDKVQQYLDKFDPAMIDEMMQH
jgi:hypothetical protein